MTRRAAEWSQSFRQQKVQPRRVLLLTGGQLCASPWHFIESSVRPDLGGCSELPFGWETLPDVEIRFIRKAMEYGTCTPIDRAYDSIFFSCDSLSSHFRLYGSPASVYRFVGRVHDHHFRAF